MDKRVIFVAGASGGLGSGIANALASSCVVVRHGHAHAPTGDDLVVQADVGDPDAVDAAVAKVLERYGRIDGLVNATGLSLDGFAHKQSFAQAQQMMHVNVLGAMNLVRAVLPTMRAQNFGRIVLISSVVYQKPAMGTSAYAAAKAALVGYARAVAVENAAKGVTCNAIALGYFDAGMLHKIPENLREQIRAAIPMQRFGRVEELVKAVQFLMDTEYMTGQTLSLNGGLVTA